MEQTLGATRTRDAAQTRQQLLQAARARFARDGYTSTTVRDIAADAGVNVALINRYFDSKEGLFEACIARVGEELDRPEGAATTLDELARRLVDQLVGFSSEQAPAQLVLLLRTSGDERANAIRRKILRSFAEKMAGVAGGDPSDERFLMRAEVVIGAALGIAHLRLAGLEPLTSARGELLEPIRDLVHALLDPAGS